MHPARYAVNCSILFTEVPLLARPAAARQAADGAKKLLVEHQVPVVVEVILERITNVAMGTEIDNVVEFEELADVRNPVPTLSGPRRD